MRDRVDSGPTKELWRPTVSSFPKMPYFQASADALAAHRSIGATFHRAPETRDPIRPRRTRGSQKGNQ